MKHSLKDWILATRPWSFPASSMPVLVTLFWLLANGDEVNWLLGILALVNIIFVHAAGNVWSDYFDYKKGVDRDDTYSVQTLTSGQFTPQEVMRLSVVLQIIAVAMGIMMVCLCGLPLLWIGLTGIALSLCYPPLKYVALGDVVIALCYSVLPMVGVSFIASGEIHWPVLWLAVPVGLITIGILHANNTRDIETDVRARIHTFSMLTGRAFAAGVYYFEVLFPYLWMLGLCVFGVTSWWTMLSWLSLPLALQNVKTMSQWKTGGIAAFARLDEATAKLQMAFSLTLIVGLLVWHFTA
ncbi:MAG: prenyltransferase [Bacteroidales bacterium]|nr:prenyltransferase [Bacteroidales bacterium]